MRLDFFITILSATLVASNILEGTLTKKTTPSNQGPSLTMTKINESVNDFLRKEQDCPTGTYVCGNLCCPSPGTCSVDVTANFHCCADNTFCTANTTNTPVSAGSRILSLPLPYWFTILVSVVLVSGNVHVLLDHDSFPSTSGLPATIVTPTPAGDIDSRARSEASVQLKQRDDCAGVLWKELQMCCVKGTIPHYYSTGERGCCDKALDGQSNVQIEAQCPATVGQANLRPIGDGVVRSQASRSSPKWAKFVLSKVSGIGFWKSERSDGESGTIASSTNKEVTATKRQIIGPGCGGFDTNCQQTCPPGFATCQTSAAEAVSSFWGWTSVLSIALALGSLLMLFR